MALRPALSLVLHELLAAARRSEPASGARRALTIDAIAHALGHVSASADEIEELFAALEAEGHTIEDGADATSPKDTLVTVLEAARRLTLATGSRPSVAELACETGFTEDAVRAALRFAGVMAR